MAKHLKADLDDMVFEDRERNYGAYILRKRYPRYLSVAVGVVSFLALLGSFGPLIAKGMGWVKGKVERGKVEIQIKLEDLPPPPSIDEVKELPKPPPPVVIEQKQVEFRIPEPSPEPDLEDTTTIHKIEDLIDQNLGSEDIEGEDVDMYFTGDIVDEEPEVLIIPDPPADKFIVAEEEPVPVNINEIAKLVGYPTIPREAGIEGKVVVRILVDKNGVYKNHKVLRDPHPLLTQAVEKHIDKLSFTPAIQGGRPIKFWINIPFDFKLINH